MLSTYYKWSECLIGRSSARKCGPTFQLVGKKILIKVIVTCLFQRD
jgi:hypothetical protein